MNKIKIKNMSYDDVKEELENVNSVIIAITAMIMDLERIDKSLLTVEKMQVRLRAIVNDLVTDQLRINAELVLFDALIE